MENNDSKFRLFVFLSSFIQSAGLYGLYIRYSQLTFRPPPPSPDWTVMALAQWYPENEIQLYIIGFILVPLVGLGFYLLLKNVLSKINSDLLNRVASLYLRISFISFLLLWWVLQRASLSNLLYISALYFFFISIITLFFTVTSDKFLKSIAMLSNLIDITSGIGLSLASFLIIRNIFFTDYFSSSDYLKIFQNAELYVYFHGFNWLQFTGISAAIIVPFLLYIFRPRALIFFFSQKSVKFYLDLFSIIIIILLFSIINPYTLKNGQLIFGRDYTAVMGTVNDIIGGKTVLVNSFSQYGLIMPYALSIIINFIPLNHSTFFYVNYAVNLLGLCLIYLALRKWLRNFFFPIFWIFLVFAHYYFAVLTNILFNGQSSMIRFGCWLVIFLYILFAKSIIKNNLIRRSLELIIVGISVFWAFDVGIYIFFSYTAYIFIRDLLANTNLKSGFISFCNSFFYLMVSLTVIFLSINLFSFLRSGGLPDWKEYMFHTFMFSNGYGQALMPVIGHHLIFIFFHCCLILYIIYILFEKQDLTIQKKNDLPLVGFLASYATTSFLYYVGESRPNQIELLMLPDLVLFCWFMYHVFQKKTYELFNSLNKSEKFVISSFGILVLMSFLIINTVGVLNFVHLYPYHKPLEYFASEKVFEKSWYNDSINWLNNYLKEIPPYKRKLAIISEDDYNFLFATKSTNIIDSGNNYYFHLKSQYYKLCDQLLARIPQYIFIEHGMGWEWTEILRNCSAKYYHYVDNIGFLDRWERN